MVAERLDVTIERTGILITLVKLYCGIMRTLALSEQFIQAYLGIFSQV